MDTLKTRFQTPTVTYCNFGKQKANKRKSINKRPDLGLLYYINLRKSLTVSILVFL